MSLRSKVSTRVAILPDFQRRLNKKLILAMNRQRLYNFREMLINREEPALKAG